MEYYIFLGCMKQQSSQQQLSLRSDNVSIPMLLFTKNINSYCVYALLTQRLIARYPKQTPSKNTASQLDLFFHQFSGHVSEP